MFIIKILLVVFGAICIFISRLLWNSEEKTFNAFIENIWLRFDEWTNNTKQTPSLWSNRCYALARKLFIDSLFSKKLVTFSNYIVCYYFCLFSIVANFIALYLTYSIRSIKIKSSFFQMDGIHPIYGLDYFIPFFSDIRITPLCIDIPPDFRVFVFLCITGLLLLALLLFKFKIEAEIYNIIGVIIIIIGICVMWNGTGTVIYDFSATDNSQFVKFIEYSPLLKIANYIPILTLPEALLLSFVCIFRKFLSYYKNNLSFLFRLFLIYTGLLIIHSLFLCFIFIIIWGKHNNEFLNALEGALKLALPGIIWPCILLIELIIVSTSILSILWFILCLINRISYKIGVENYVWKKTLFYLGTLFLLIGSGLSITDYFQFFSF